MPVNNSDSVQKDVLVWSTSDSSAPPTLGSTFTVTGTPDLMSFNDEEGVVRPGDFNSGAPNTIEPNQTLSGLPEGQEFTGNHGSADVFEFEIALQVTDRVNTNDGCNDVIVGEGGGATIMAGTGDDLLFGDHVDELSAGTTGYIAKGFIRDLNFELESGCLTFANPTGSISGTPVEIRFLDTDGVLDGVTLAERQ